MSGERLTARVERGGGGARIVLAGDLDGTADAVVAGAYAEATSVAGAHGDPGDSGDSGAGDSGEIVLDFGATGYINSTGIALVVRLLAEARRERRPVRAVGLTEHYREVFRITRLSDFMTIEEPAATPEG